MNLKYFIKNYQKLVWFNDPFGIRLQQMSLIILFPISIFSMSYFGVLYIDTHDRTSTNLYKFTTLDTYSSNASFFYGIISIEYLTQIFYFVVVTLISTIWKELNQQIVGIKLSNQEFDEYLKDLNIYLSFKEYCDKQWILEYLLFYEDVQHFIEISDLKKRNKRASKILKLYLSGNSSDLEIQNIPGNLIQIVFEEISLNTKNKREEISNDLFESILNLVKIQLKDRFSVFMSTDSFKIACTE